MSCNAPIKSGYGFCSHDGKREYNGRCKIHQYTLTLDQLEVLLVGIFLSFVISLYAVIKKTEYVMMNYFKAQWQLERLIQNNSAGFVRRTWNYFFPLEIEVVPSNQFLVEYVLIIIGFFLCVLLSSCMLSISDYIVDIKHRINRNRK